MKEEEWRGIPDFEGFQASNLGRVKRLPHVDSSGHARKERVLTKKFVKGTGWQNIADDRASKGAYVRLVRDDYKHFVSVAECVWTAFEGKFDPRLSTLRFRDGTPNPKLTNLRLVPTGAGATTTKINERLEMIKEISKTAQPTRSTHEHTDYHTQL